VKMLERQRVQQAAVEWSSVLPELSGLENVVFNNFIDDVLDSEAFVTCLCHSREHLPLCQILFQESQRKSVLHVNTMRWLRSMLSGIMRETQM